MTMSPFEAALLEEVRGMRLACDRIAAMFDASGQMSDSPSDVAECAHPADGRRAIDDDTFLCTTCQRRVAK